MWNNPFLLSSCFWLLVFIIDVEIQLREYPIYFKLKVSLKLWKVCDIILFCIFDNSIYAYADFGSLLFFISLPHTPLFLPKFLLFFTLNSSYFLVFFFLTLWVLLWLVCEKRWLSLGKLSVTVMLKKMTLKRQHHLTPHNDPNGALAMPDGMMRAPILYRTG